MSRHRGAAERVLPLNRLQIYGKDTNEANELKNKYDFLFIFLLRFYTIFSYQGGGVSIIFQVQGQSQDLTLVILNFYSIA